MAVIIQGLCNTAPIPLFYEMAIESNYPIDEIVTSGMMSIMYNVFPIAFLGIFFIPNIGEKTYGNAEYVEYFPFVQREVRDISDAST